MSTRSSFLDSPALYRATRLKSLQLLAREAPALMVAHSREPVMKATAKAARGWLEKWKTRRSQEEAIILRQTSQMAAGMLLLKAAKSATARLPTRTRSRAIKPAKDRFEIR